MHNSVLEHFITAKQGGQLALSALITRFISLIFRKLAQVHACLPAGLIEAQDAAGFEYSLIIGLCIRRRAGVKSYDLCPRQFCISVCVKKIEHRGMAQQSLKPCLQDRSLVCILQIRILSVCILPVCTLQVCMLPVCFAGKDSASQ